MPPASLADQTREALRLQRAGRLDRARTLHEQILAKAPRHPPACNGLALIELAAGRAEEALRLLAVALEEKPDSAIYRNNFANALKALGRLDEAAVAYRAALELEPGYANARYNLAMLEQMRGRAAAARAQLEALLATQPAFVPAWIALSGLLVHAEGPARAEACLRRGLQAVPGDAALLLELGALLRQQDRIDEAIACLERAVVLRPDRTATFNDLGALHQLKGRIEPALACFDRALELDASSGHAHFNRAKLAADLNRFEEAALGFERAMALEPTLATEAACHLAVARRHLCDWRDEVARTAELVARIEALVRDDTTRGLPPLTLNVVAVPAALRLAVACHLGRGVEREMAARRGGAIASRAERREVPRPRDPLPAEPERLRVGYVSPDFRIHAVGSLIYDLFRHHDRSQVEVFAYSLLTVDDAFARSIRRGVDHFIDVSRGTPETIAERIRADRIDVLVDVAGYTTWSKTGIFALRPAPVQMHWLGYLDTMGADFLPYLLADETVVPETATADYSETIITLPRGFAVASPLPIAATPTRASLDLPDDAFVFCCMNGLHKLETEVFDAWMRILARVPDSVLWLADEGSATARANLAREATVRGIDPKRLHFAPRAPLPEYLARYRVADLFLDTFAYNAGATAAGALRAGLPVLTRPGQSFMSRMGASLCRGAGLPEMVCADTAEYEARAIELAGDRSALAALRARLEAAQKGGSLEGSAVDRMAGEVGGRTPAPLFDLPGCARQLEAAYRAAWHHRADGSPERRIKVAV